MYSSMYDHCLPQELSGITKEIYKPRDSRLHKLLFDRLQYLMFSAQQKSETKSQIAKIRQLIGLQPTGFPALSQLEIFDEDLHMHMGI